MFKTGPVAVAISQDMQQSVNHYFRTLQEQYTPHVIAHERVNTAMQENFIQYKNEKAIENLGMSQYEQSRNSVRERHSARFAGRAAPCKYQ